ncbi:MAG TPA: hypothetical protein VLS90_12160, partial [Thermodesulfobacteriota bacterium]|nr:hypothetical protein [Thermodesulfobacteriota bacterium]
VDSNSDGIPDMCDAYPHKIKDVYFIFSPYEKPKTASEADAVYYYPSMIEGGQSVKVYILGEDKFNFSSVNTVMTTTPEDRWPLFPTTQYVTRYGFTNQMGRAEIPVCCEAYGVPSCGTEYKENCCEALFRSGCDVRYLSQVTRLRGAMRWAGATIMDSMPSFPWGTPQCSRDDLKD